MATIGTQNLTLLDLQKRMDPNGNVAQIIEQLNQSTEIIQDMTMVECNQGSSFVTTVRTGLPDVTWRKLYGGVQASKSSTRQITDNCGMLEAYSQTDKALVDKSKDKASFRATEDKAFVESMGQELCRTIFYGDENTPEKFIGLAPRFNTLDIKKAASAENILDAGGTGNLASIWLVGWGPLSVHGIYPEGSAAGLHQEDKGVVTVTKEDGSMFEAYRTHFKHDVGLTVRDWRNVVRIANIDVTKLTNDAKAGADLINLMIEAEERIPNLGGVRPVWYMNRTLRTFLRLQKNTKHGSTITEDMEMGKLVTRANGVPVRKIDALLSTESRVIA